MNIAGHEASPPAVLVAEDEPMLLMVAAETLRDAGYAVWTAGNGDAALEILKRETGIALLITDIKMPGMSGYQLAEASTALRPDLKLLFMTGYAQDPIPAKMSAAKVRVLYKPFDIEQLPLLANQILERA